VTICLCCFSLSCISVFLFFLSMRWYRTNTKINSREKKMQKVAYDRRGISEYFFLYSVSRPTTFNFLRFFLRGFFYASTFFIKKLINRHWTRDNMMLKHIIYVSIFFSPLLSTGCCMCLLNNVWLCHVMYKEKKKSESERVSEIWKS
jgi:hypothetical protein